VFRLRSVVIMLTMSAVLPGSFALAAAASGLPIHITDALGRQVTLQAFPQRLVSLAPSNTERLFAVGAGPPSWVSPRWIRIRLRSLRYAG